MAEKYEIVLSEKPPPVPRKGRRTKCLGGEATPRKPRAESLSNAVSMHGNGTYFYSDSPKAYSDPNTTDCRHFFVHVHEYRSAMIALASRVDCAVYPDFKVTLTRAKQDPEVVFEFEGSFYITPLAAIPDGLVRSICFLLVGGIPLEGKELAPQLKSASWIDNLTEEQCHQCLIVLVKYNFKSSEKYDANVGPKIGRTAWCRYLETDADSYKRRLKFCLGYH